MRCIATAVRGPGSTLPVDKVSRGLASHAFPPHVPIIGERNVGEDDVALEHFHRVRIGRIGRSRSDSEVAGFGIDRIETTVSAWLDPGDIVTDG